MDNLNISISLKFKYVLLQYPYHNLTPVSVIPRLSSVVRRAGKWNEGTPQNEHKIDLLCLTCLYLLLIYCEVFDNEIEDNFQLNDFNSDINNETFHAATTLINSEPEILNKSNLQLTLHLQISDSEFMRVVAELNI